MPWPFSIVAAVFDIAHCAEIIDQKTLFEAQRMHRPPRQNTLKIQYRLAAYRQRAGKAGPNRQLPTANFATRFRLFAFSPFRLFAFSPFRLFAFSPFRLFASRPNSESRSIEAIKPKKNFPPEHLPVLQQKSIQNEH